MEGDCPLLVFLACVFLFSLASPVFLFTKEEFTENKVEMFCRGHSPVSCHGPHFSVTKGGPATGMGRSSRLPDWGLGHPPPQDFTGVAPHARRISNTEFEGNPQNRRETLVGRVQLVKHLPLHSTRTCEALQNPGQNGGSL